MRRFILLALVVIVMAGCAGQVKVDPIEVTTNSLAIVGEQALATNTLYYNLCVNEAIGAEQCAAWQKFFTRFKSEYPFAARAYIAAIEGGDVTSAEDAVKRIQALSTELTLYFLLRGK